MIWAQSKSTAFRPAALPSIPTTAQRVPIWVANYILADYGTGAIMSVPAHDERDFEFATKYGLPIVQVIKPADPSVSQELPFCAHEGVVVNSDPAGRWAELRRRAEERCKRLPSAGQFGEPKITFRLKDWGVSRQRYWGTPIPMIHCEKCGLVQVPDEQLPVLLPAQIEITQQGGSPLSRVPEFRQCQVPQVRRPGQARNRHDGHLRRFELVLLSLHGREERQRAL